MHLPYLNFIDNLSKIGQVLAANTAEKRFPYTQTVGLEGKRLLRAISGNSSECHYKSQLRTCGAIYIKECRATYTAFDNTNYCPNHTGQSSLIFY